VPRIGHYAPIALPGARLLMATCLSLWSAGAFAQTPPPLAAPDPLSPNLQTNPRQPPRFEKSAKPGQTQLGPPVNTWSPAAGAGVTGFDSTNARRKIKLKGPQPSGNPVTPVADGNAIAPAANPPPDAKAAAAQARAMAPGIAVPLTISRYQTPPPDTSAFANAQGGPPVELGPIRKLPPKRKAHTELDDPYAPLGVHAGTFDLFPAIELIGGYNSNAGQSANGQGAALYTVAPELQAQSNWSRHELKADLRGSYTGFSPDQTPSLSRPYFNGKVDGRIDVTRTTRVDLNTRLLVSTDNPGSPNLQAGLAKLPLYATFGGSGGVTHQFNRLELGAKGDIERTTYQASTLTDGTLASNGDRAYNQYTGTLRAAYELKPGVKPYVEAGADSRVHDLETDFNGFQRNSTGITAKVGSTFDLPARLTGEVAVGYTSRKYADPRFDTLSGLLGNASLIWTASALTTVKLSATSTVNESTVPGVSGIFSRDIGLQIDHSLRRWLIASAKFGFGVDSYRGGNDTSTGSAAVCDCVITTPGETSPDRQDLRYTAGFGLTYKLSREVQIKGEVRRDWLHSNVPGNDYTADTFLLGLRFQR
jgi:hypothetical protein